LESQNSNVLNKIKNKKKKKNKSTNNKKSRDSSVGIALGYGMDDRDSRVRFSAGNGNFSLHHRVQNGSGAHLAAYPMGSSVSFPGGNPAEE
jgi:hypothetical protein